MNTSTMRMRNRAIGWLYQHAAKPVFFRCDPERVHDGMIILGSQLGETGIGRLLTHSTFAAPEDPRLAQTIQCIRFPNPIGLAGGFDKNARLVDILPDVGFGFMEVGSITAKPYDGNPGRHLWRLPKTKSLVVNYGLKNTGADVIAKRLASKHPRIPLGINIAKTNNRDTCAVDGGIADYLETHRRFHGIGDYETINVSCPNAFGGQPFHEPEALDALLETLDLPHSDKPAFIKISPDLDVATIDAIVDIAIKRGAAGIICTNLTKRRDPELLRETDVPDVGGLSGKAVDHLADAMIQRISQRANGKLIIIACGGVFTAEDAYRKIRLGASLVQLITGMIFEGPQLISDINLGLLKLLERDGFTNISQVIAQDSHPPLPSSGTRSDPELHHL